MTAQPATEAPEEVRAAVTAPAKEWITALNSVAPAISGRPPVPILVNCVITPGQTTTIQANNYETYAETIIDREAAGTPFLAPHRWLAHTIRQISGRNKAADITVTADGKKLTVSGRGYTLHLEAELSPAEYPDRPSLQFAPALVETAGFRAAFRKAAVAASKDETLPILNGVKLELAPGQLGIWATDRYRLVHSIMALEGGAKAAAVVKARLIEATLKHLKDDGINLGIVDDETGTSVVLRSGSTTYAIRATDGEYPPLAKLFPDEVDSSVEVDADVLREAASVARALSDYGMPCTIAIDGTGAVLTSNEGVFGRSTTPKAEGGYVAGEKEDAVVAFNSRYLVDALQSITTKNVRISRTKPAKPWLFTEEGQPAGTAPFRHLIMPVRLPH